MDGSDILNAFYYRKLNDENLEKQLDKVTKFINEDFQGIVENSFKSGFEEGDKIARADERLIIRGKIVGKLFAKTDLTDEEIYDIIAFNEEQWKEHIKYLRKQYDEGVKIGKLGLRDDTQKD